MDACVLQMWCFSILMTLSLQLHVFVEGTATHSLELGRSGHWPFRPSSALCLCRCLRAELLCLSPQSCSIWEESCSPVKEVSKICNYSCWSLGQKPQREACGPRSTLHLKPRLRGYCFIFLNECEERNYYEYNYRIQMDTDHIDGGGRWRSWGRGRRGRNRHLGPVLATS